MKETVPEAGEVMMLTFHQNKFSWRAVIYVGPPEEPNNAAEMFVGEWKNSLRKAQASGLRQYFDLYESRYGFKHPEDPKRTQSDGAMPYNVISVRGNGIVAAHTVEELPEYARADH
jgi:hypothetical protein